MSWLGSHPYTSSSLAAGLLIVIGAGIVVTRSGVMPATPSHTETWGSSNSFFTTPPSPISQSSTYTDSSNFNSAHAVQAAYVSPFATNTTALMATDNTSVDLDTLLSSLSHPSTQNTPNGSKSIHDYELIPTGLISLSNVSADSTKTKDSPIQAALRDYGNSAGNAIMSFENLHLNQASILKDHAEAPYDTGKVQLLARLGTDYIELGDTISKIDPIPLPLAALHKRLVADYRDLGKKLVAVSKSPGSLYDAIVEYDASADQFAKDFISLALTFPTYGVRFQQGEGGSTFQFAGNSAL